MVSTKAKLAIISASHCEGPLRAIVPIMSGGRSNIKLTLAELV
jgi:hypothetical protein